MLIVEDNVSVSGLLGDVIGGLGCEARVERDGKRALKRIRADPPDLVLIDLRLPGIDGLEVVRALRSEGGLGELPVIALTGYTHVHSSAEALREGCDAFFEKPFEVRALREKVGELLGRRGVRLPVDL